MPKSPRTRAPRPSERPLQSAGSPEPNRSGTVGLISAEDRETWTRWANEQAQDSFRRGESCWRAGDYFTALSWLERAHRMAPDSPNVAFLLAAARQANGLPDGAVDLLRRLLEKFDFREGWSLLSTILLAARRPEDAAASLSRGLSSHACDDQMASLANRVADATASIGWCGLNSDGSIRLGGDALGYLESSPPRSSRGRTRGTAASLERLAVHIDGEPAQVTAQGGKITLRSASVSVVSAREITVYLDGAPLPGSPLRPSAINRVEGLVRSGPNGLQGWAWLPRDPDRPPTLHLLDARNDRLLSVFSPDVFSTDVSSDIPLARYREILIPCDQCPDHPVRVTGPDGRDLAGSPLDPGLERRAARWAARQTALWNPEKDRAATDLPPPFLPIPVEMRPAAQRLKPAPLLSDKPPAEETLIVVPVYGDAKRTKACLDSLVATLPTAQGKNAAVRVAIIEDASPDAELVAMLNEFVADPRVTVLHNSINLGFPGSANVGLRLALAQRPAGRRRAAVGGGADVVLLNSDTLVTDGWLEELRRVAHSAPDIGTVTPLSNDATILSYPTLAGSRSPTLAQTRWMAGLARQANGGDTVDLPTAHGFCMLIRHDCLAATGLLRADLFAQGYGEENDFSLRARALGWRNVAAPGAYVAHVGSASFGATRDALLRRNLALLNRLHPGYDALVRTHVAQDPLFDARRRIDLLRWRRGWRTEFSQHKNRASDASRRAVVFITHDHGGGVERVVSQRARRMLRQGVRPIIVKPVEGGCRVEGFSPDAEDRHRALDPEAGVYPNLRFRLPEEWTSLLNLLGGAEIDHVEWHHGSGHHPQMETLAASIGAPQDVFVHDYIWFCPRISLLGQNGRYCGEPDVAECESCVARLGRKTPGDEAVAEYVSHSSERLSAARRVSAPSGDAAQRMLRHFPALKIDVEPPEDDDAEEIRAAHSPSAVVGLPRTSRARVCIVGAIGREKGYDVILEAAEDARRRNLPIEYVIVGHTPDDTKLIETGHVYVTGAYEDSEAAALVRAQNADYAFIPSIWPETWCLALSVAWRAGLDVAAFDLGAVADRIRAKKRGSILPLGVSANRLNVILTSLCQRRNETLTGIRQTP
ncbi:glycosyltransferase [Acetobacter sacchari]|uniref:Glycosyltransferase n=1 Tax=Acetobacter sacchari TaxID=2661687 RepID=A0ABS3LTF9_9PROT|nr:glycosyltransferase [Acetobacter sacchari]MBO1359191.1 glycosyltransferase [Acetobacter sacchari]